MQEGERLTYRYGRNGEYANFITGEKDGCQYRASFEGAKKLADYEDSGISPEEINEIAKIMSEGRLLILPATDNAVIYCINDNSIHEVFITHIEKSYTHKDGVKFTGIIDECDDWECDLSDFGKTVFCTYDEAQKELAIKEE